jgi:hypothetical protein
MALAIGIVTLLGSLVSVAFWWIKRAASKADDPATIRTNETERVDGAIAAGARGVDEVNRLVAAGVVGAESLGVSPGGVSVGKAQSSGDSVGPVDPVGSEGIDELNRRLPGASGANAGNPAGSAR